MLANKTSTTVKMHDSSSVLIPFSSSPYPPLITASMDPSRPRTSLLSTSSFKLCLDEDPMNVN